MDAVAFTSAENSIVEGVRRGRKRKQQQNIPRKRQPKPPPGIETICKCSYQCKEINDVKTQLYEAFNRLDENGKGNYLLGLLDILPVQRRRHGTYDHANDSRRQATVSYTIPDASGCMKKVCKKTFLDIFGVSPQKITLLVKTKRSGQTIYKDKRGGARHIKYTMQDRVTVRTHINSFPKEVSHYGRGKNDKEFLSSDLNLNRLFLAFKDKFPDTQITYKFYRKVFLKDFPLLSFKRPLVDTCRSCDLFHNKSKSGTVTESRQAKISLEVHQRKADVPRFGEPIINVTAPVGREATLVCVVDDLGSYKVAWLRVDTQTILTIHNHVITKNHRIGVTHSDHRTWILHVREIRQTDRGWYMCQINTDPMKSQVGFLDVVVPPDILDSPTSTDMVIREGSPVTLRCAASGSPAPNITWRREGGEAIPLSTGQEALSVEGPSLNISRVNRLHMGAYLCIASNGVPPSVSKRIMLTVHFPPMIWIQNQLIGSREGQQLILECHSEAYPKSINYWTRDKGEIIAHGPKYEPVLVEHLYKVIMRLTIKALGPGDYGAYKCVSKNSLGDTDGTIKVYPVLMDKVSTAKPRHKDKSRLRPKYGNHNEIGDSSGLAKQRELKVGTYDELGDEDEGGSSACDLGSSWLIISLVFPTHYLRTYV